MCVAAPALKPLRQGDPAARPDVPRAANAGGQLKPACRRDKRAYASPRFTRPITWHRVLVRS